MELAVIQSRIYEVRGVKVMLDKDLAALYQVEVRALNQAVKRNMKRVPPDFMFQLTKEEWENLKSHFVTSNWAVCASCLMLSRNKGLRCCPAY